VPISAALRSRAHTIKNGMSRLRNSREAVNKILVDRSREVRPYTAAPAGGTQVKEAGMLYHIRRALHQPVLPRSQRAARPLAPCQDKRVRVLDTFTATERYGSPGWRI